MAVHRHTLQSDTVSAEGVGDCAEVVPPLTLGRLDRHLVALQSQQIGASVLGLAPRRYMRYTQHRPKPFGYLPAQHAIVVEQGGKVDDRCGVDNLRP